MNVSIALTALTVLGLDASVSGCFMLNVWAFDFGDRGLDLDESASSSCSRSCLLLCTFLLAQHLRVRECAVRILAPSPCTSSHSTSTPVYLLPSEPGHDDIVPVAWARSHCDRHNPSEVLRAMSLCIFSLGHNALYETWCLSASTQTIPQP